MSLFCGVFRVAQFPLRAISVRLHGVSKRVISHILLLLPHSRSIKPVIELTIHNVAPYLCGRGLLRPAELGDPLLRIEGRRRWNRNFIIKRRSLPWLFVKQRDGDADPDSDPRALYATYASAAGAPECLDYDRNARIMVTRFIPDSETLEERSTRMGEIDRRAAVALGTRLGGFHLNSSLARLRKSSGQHCGSGAQLLAYSVQDRAWIVSKQWNPEQAAVWQVMHHFEPFVNLLRAAVRGRRIDGFMHGDLKGSNILVFEDGAREIDVAMIDWDLAGEGDTAWDTGTVIQGFVLSWILSLSGEALGKAGRQDSETGEVLRKNWPAIRAFWESYCAHRKLDVDAQREFLCRTVVCAALALVQSAIEISSVLSTAFPWTTAALQTSWNILRDPGGASSDLFGLGPPESGTMPVPHTPELVTRPGEGRFEPELRVVLAAAYSSVRIVSRRVVEFQRNATAANGGSVPLAIGRAEAIGDASLIGLLRDYFYERWYARNGRPSRTIDDWYFPSHSSQGNGWGGLLPTPSVSHEHPSVGSLRITAWGAVSGPPLGSGIVRFYFHASQDSMPSLAESLTLSLEGSHIPFNLKYPAVDLLYERSDAAVLYVPSAWESDCRRIIENLDAELLARLNPDTPLFTVQLAPGIGMAEDPGYGASFGSHRSTLVAEAIYDAWLAGDGDLDRWLLRVEQKFREAGIDPRRPYRRFANSPEVART